MDTIQQNQRSNKIFQTIKGFELMFPDEFEKCDIKKCGRCMATGLEDQHDMSSYCEECHGIGYKGYTKLFNEFVCRSCGGAGCNSCDDRGQVDWITHAMGSEE